MTDGIIIAVVTGLCSVIGQWLISRRNIKDDEIKRAVRDQKTDDRLKAIETKLDIHNGYAEKFSDIDVTLTEIKQDIKYLKKGRTI